MRKKIKHDEKQQKTNVSAMCYRSSCTSEIDTRGRAMCCSATNFSHPWVGGGWAVSMLEGVGNEAWDERLVNARDMLRRMGVTRPEREHL